jgi:hypothetical protein
MDLDFTTSSLKLDDDISVNTAVTMILKFKSCFKVKIWRD